MWFLGLLPIFLQYVWGGVLHMPITQETLNKTYPGISMILLAVPLTAVYILFNRKKPQGPVGYDDQQGSSVSKARHSVIETLFTIYIVLTAVGPFALFLSPGGVGPEGLAVYIVPIIITLPLFIFQSKMGGLESFFTRLVTVPGGVKRFGIFLFFFLLPIFPVNSIPVIIYLILYLLLRNGPNAMKATLVLGAIIATLASFFFADGNVFWPIISFVYIFTPFMLAYITISRAQKSILLTPEQRQDGAPVA